LSILDINQNGSKAKSIRTIVVYLFTTVFTFMINKLYASFGHGVYSNSMTWMFLYPLIGGVLFYFIIEFFLPNVKCFVGYRVFYNIYNSGIALLTVASFLQGIVEVAGTNSPYVTIYFKLGYLCVAVGVFILIIMNSNYKKVTGNNGKSN